MQRLDDLDLDYLKPEWGDRDSALLLQWVSALKLYPKFADYIIRFIFYFWWYIFFPDLAPLWMSRKRQGPFGPKEFDWLRAGMAFSAAFVYLNPHSCHFC